MKLFSQKLLSWYDIHARNLPWRILPSDKKQGLNPDPYKIWLSEVMLQQTTVPAVKSYFEKFTTLWKTVESLANADNDSIMVAWAGLGYYARARNLHKCAKIIASDYNGIFPDSVEELKKLPGIGDYTAAAVASIAFDKAATVVDGNVDRVISRIFAITTPLPNSKPEIYQKAQELTPQNRAGDYAQAMMDLGATICTPTNPSCLICPVIEFCQAHKQNIAEQLPYKIPKKQRPILYGNIYWVLNDKNQVLIQKRPEKGLLGNMMEFPNTQWLENKNLLTHNLNYLEVKNKVIGKVKHIFTHFELNFDIYAATINPNYVLQSHQIWCNINNLNNIALPSLMKKVFKMVYGKD